MSLARCVRPSLPFVLALLPLIGCRHELTRPVPMGLRLETVAARENGPPSATILEPRPSSLFVPSLTPPVTISWTGDDVDGRVLEYRYRLFTSDNLDLPVPDFIELFNADPDAVLRHYAPDFQGWERLRVKKSPDASVTYALLDTGRRYVFVVVAIDHRGACDAHLSRGRNALEFAVPVIPPSVTFTGPFGSVTNPVEPVVVPAGLPTTIRWQAQPPPGLTVVGYRQGIDQPPVSGQHSLADNVATVDPPSSGSARILWVETLLSDGHLSLASLVLSFTGTGAGVATPFKHTTQK